MVALATRLQAARPMPPALAVAIAAPITGSFASWPGAGRTMIGKLSGIIDGRGGPR